MFWIVLLLVVGALAIAVGVVYLVEPSHSLPSFFPGHLNSPARPVASAAFHRKRGEVGVIAGAVLVIAAIVVGFARPTRAPGPARAPGSDA
jgi:hypothetical protein